VHFEIETDTHARKIWGHPAALRQLYVITFGSIGNGMLPVSCQEQVVPVSLCIGLWIRSQNISPKSDMYTILLIKRKTNTHAPKIDYLCTKPTKPKLTDFYNGLGEGKLPPYPFKLFDH
jgi:hypothetical protein